MSSAHDERLRAYLEKIVGPDRLEHIAERAVGRLSRAAGVEAAGRSEGAGATANEAVRKLNARLALDPRERFNVEAIILPDLRPAVRIAGGDYNIDHATWRHFNDASHKRTLCGVLPSIGRIELPNHPSLPYGGTGFMVGRGLLMTNRHVAEIFASGNGRYGLRFRAGLKAGIDFRKETEEDPADHLDIADVVMIHPYWDMALLKVNGLGEQRVPLRLSLTHPADLAAREVAVIGYPAFDPRNPSGVQDQVFGGIYNVKRLQPGLVREMRSVGSFDHAVEAMTHDSSTLGGNSGSAIIDATDGTVLGLHFGGLYLDANFGVPAHSLSLDARVVDAGVVFSGQAAPGPSAADNAWTQVEAAGGAPPAPPPVSPIASGGDSSGGQPSVGGLARTTFNLPLRITVELGAPVVEQPKPGIGGTTPPSTTSAPAATEKMVEPIRDTNYADRKGYDPDFLGVRVPFPQPRDPAIAAAMSDGGIEIPYHHFSVIMHGERRLALITGGNADASPARKRPGNRPDFDYTRDGLAGMTDNDQEQWFSDQRLKADQQLSDRFFNKDRKAFDKGHLIRREDVAWGDTYDEMRFANGDTFHITNCSPQTAGFNRAAAQNWGALENIVLSQAKTERLSVFAGPVLAAADRNFRGVDDDSGVILVPIPSRYWKVIVAVRDGAVESFCFVLEQDLSNVNWEFAVPTDWVALMRPITEIEQMTGIVFPANVRAGDQAGTPHGEAVRVAGGIETAKPAAAPAAVVASGGPPVLADMVDDLSPILDGWRAQQDKGGIANTVRLTLNFSGSRPADAELTGRLQQALGVKLDVTALFDPDPDLDRFRSVTIPGVSPIDQQDMFDLARLVRAITDADSVDPDLGSNYYDYDPPDDLPAMVESSIAFWCWAPDEEKPADPDWAMVSTRVPEAWAFSEQKAKPAKGKGIRVFQPDTGVVTNHGELGQNLNLIPGAANFVEGGTSALDPMKGGLNPGHGTGTGSVVISAEAGTMRGVAPLATLVPVRCLKSVAVFDQSPVAKAIDHARKNGAHVISMSLGGVMSSALHAAVKKAVAANIVVIAAAGNCVGEVVWPARYAETIGVGGVNAASKPWRGSSRGASVTVSGPAEFVLRADARNETDPNAVSGGQGTSFATAHLAGVAALWLAHHGRDDLIALLPAGRTLQDMFRAVIRASAKTPQGFDTSNYGAGIVNAEATLRRDPVAALAAAVQPAGGGMLDQLTSLLDGVFGGGAAESASPALVDPQNYPELAAAAFERLRAGRSRLAVQEAMPPTGLSVGLRRTLGAASAKFAHVEASDVF